MITERGRIYTAKRKEELYKFSAISGVKIKDCFDSDTFDLSIVSFTKLEFGILMVSLMFECERLKRLSKKPIVVHC